MPAAATGMLCFSPLPHLSLEKQLASYDKILSQDFPMDWSFIAFLFSIFLMKVVIKICFIAQMRPLFDTCTHRFKSQRKILDKKVLRLMRQWLTVRAIHVSLCFRVLFNVGH